MNLKVVVIILVSCLIPTLQASSLLSYWNFNNVASKFASPHFGSLQTAAAPFGEAYDDAKKKIFSNTANATVFHSDSVFIDVSNLKGVANGGSIKEPSWGLYTTSLLNKVETDRSPNGGSLCVFKGGKNDRTYITISLSSKGYKELVVSYSMRTNNNSTAVQEWSFSVDGTNFSPLSSFKSTNGEWVVQKLELPSQLENQAAFYLRLTFDNISGASSCIDNFQLTGTLLAK